MGAVYEAVHDAIGRRVAIKVLLSAFAKDAQFTSGSSMRRGRSTWSSIRVWSKSRILADSLMAPLIL